LKNKKLLEKYTFYNSEIKKDMAVISGLLLAQAICARKMIEVTKGNEINAIMGIMEEITEVIEDINAKDQMLI
jgi:hypothetical protein